MSDIAKHLRMLAEADAIADPDLLNEAADEIERLRALQPANSHHEQKLRAKALEMAMGNARDRGLDNIIDVAERLFRWIKDGTPPSPEAPIQKWYDEAGRTIHLDPRAPTNPQA